MPHIALRISDTEESVVRPVVMDIVRDVLQVTNLNPDTKILFPGNTEVGYQPDTTLSAKAENREKNLFAHDKRVFIEVDEDYDEEGAVTTAVMKPENVAIFIDPDHDTYIKPVYSTIESNITFRYRAKNRVEAMRWRDNVRTKISMGRSEMLHQIQYCYLIPQPALEILEQIHTLRENIVGYNQNFEDYKKEFFTQRRTVIVTQAGTEPKEAISETQHRVVGWFDFTAKPERAERDGSGDAWIISFTYRFRYERPINVIMYYPIVIHNQLLPAKYRPIAPTDRDDYHELYRSMSTRAFHRFEAGYMVDLWKKFQGISVPNFDDFVPSQILPNSLRVFTGLVLIDMDNPEVLMDFNDLQDWRIEDDIKQFLMGEAPYVTKQYHSVFNLSFYINQDMTHQDLEMVRLDPDLKVILQEPISLRNYFHIRLSLNKDLESLTTDAIDRLRANSCVFRKILHALYPKLDIDKYLSRLAVCGPVGKDEWNQIISDVSPYPSRGNPGLRVMYNTVEGFFVTTKDTDQLAPDPKDIEHAISS